jgi:hypothetical protein
VTPTPFARMSDLLELIVRLNISATYAAVVVGGNWLSCYHDGRRSVV